MNNKESAHEHTNSKPVDVTVEVFGYAWNPLISLLRNKIFRLCE